MSKENVSKKGCKSAAFSVEVIINQDDERLLIVRNMNGQPLKTFIETSSLQEFIDDCLVEMSDKTAAE